MPKTPINLKTTVSVQATADDNLMPCISVYIWTHALTAHDDRRMYVDCQHSGDACNNLYKQCTACDRSRSREGD